MEQVKFPTHYQQVMPYLIVQDAAAFIRFLADVFDGRELMRHMRDEHTVMHAEVCIGKSVIMFAEATDAFPVCNAGLFVYVANADEVYAKALKANAVAVTPMGDQPYGRSGGVKDPFGNTWWITTEKKE